MLTGEYHQILSHLQLHVAVETKQLLHEHPIKLRTNLLLQRRHLTVSERSHPILEAQVVIHLTNIVCHLSHQQFSLLHLEVLFYVAPFKATFNYY